MREIKFRAWDKRQKLFGYIDLGSSDFGDPSWFDYPLQQYTGLKDKNGVEIYEDDVLAFPYENADGRLREEADAVSFQNGEFKLYEWSLNRWSAVSRVIGNIYENPELLK